MKQWFIQSGDEVVGPLTSHELRQLAKAGGLAPETLVSVNQQQWDRAESIPGLDVSVAKSPPLAPPPLPPPKPRRQSPIVGPWYNHKSGMIGGGLLAFVILANATLQVTRYMQQKNRPAAPQALPVATAPVRSSMGESTLQYWTAVHQQIRLAGRPNTPLSDVAATIAAVELLPTSNVDPAAINIVMEVCATFHECLLLSEQSKDPGILLEALARGYAGDPFGKGLELRQETAKAQKRLVAAAMESRRIRALLSQHYGVEFPPLVD